MEITRRWIDLMKNKKIDSHYLRLYCPHLTLSSGKQGGNPNAQLEKEKQASKQALKSIRP